MFLNALTILALSLATVARPSLSQATIDFVKRTENHTPVNSLGLQQTVEPITGLSFGVAIPENIPTGTGLLGNDFLINFTVPLPYGFAALQGDASDEANPFHIAIFMGGFRLPTGYALVDIVQFDRISTDGSTAVPVGGAVITYSPLTSWQGAAASVIFRCQNCTLGGEAHDGKVQLNAVLSEVQPSFTLADGSAPLDLKGALVVPFSLDLRTLRRGNFDDLLRVARLIS